MSDDEIDYSILYDALKEEDSNQFEGQFNYDQDPIPRQDMGGRPLPKPLPPREREENQKKPTKGDTVTKISSVFGGLTLLVTLYFVFLIARSLSEGGSFSSGKPMVLLLVFGSLFAIPAIGLSILALIWKPRFLKVRAIISLIMGIAFFATMGILQIVL